VAQELAFFGLRFAVNNGCLLTVGFTVHLSGLIGFSNGLSLCKLRVYQMCMGCVDYSNSAMTRLG